MAAKTGGCFPGGALVTMEDGSRKTMLELQLGDRVLSSSQTSGRFVFSEVIAFLDRQADVRMLFYSLETDRGAALSLTAAHLVFVSEGNCSASTPTGTATGTPMGTLRTAFASEVKPGQCVLVAQDHQHGHLSRVLRVHIREDEGVFAPLTRHGTVVVNDILSSCYAEVNEHSLAHAAFGPLRALHRWGGPMGHQVEGLHWYSSLLHWIGRRILDPKHFHPRGELANRT